MPRRSRFSPSSATANHTGSTPPSAGSRRRRGGLCQCSAGASAEIGIRPSRSPTSRGRGPDAGRARRSNDTRLPNEDDWFAELEADHTGGRLGRRGPMLGDSVNRPVTRSASGRGDYLAVLDGRRSSRHRPARTRVTASPGGSSERSLRWPDRQGIPVSRRSRRCGPQNRPLYSSVSTWCSG